MKLTNRIITVKVKTAKKRKQASTLWLKRQLNDPYVQQAKIDGYRSRAAYKIIEIDDKFKIFKKGMKVLDLGAAPGGWSQVALNRTKNGKIFALDILEMQSIPGVKFMQLDFTSDDASEKVMEFIGGKADAVLTDMAANACGNPQVDHMRIIMLCELAFEFAKSVLAENGVFVAKLLRGGGDHKLLTQIKQHFKNVKNFKPKSSRADSAEIYLVATGFKL
jgi:23S rRNA (uridine2552-2'-O)-methyltransferase